MFILYVNIDRFFFPVVFPLTFFFFKLLSASNNYINRVKVPIR